MRRVGLRPRLTLVGSCCLVHCLVSACGGGGASTDASSTGSGTGGTGSSSYTIGGTLNGVIGTLVLQDNGGNNLSLSANGAFTFSTPLASGAAYSVTLLTQPAGQTCFVANGAGTVGNANVTTVGVGCLNNPPPTYTVGGTLSGLNGTVVLQDNGGNNLSLSTNGAFTFSTALASGAAYSVTVLTQPSGQTCTVTNGAGTINGAKVTNVTVSCTTVTPQSYTVGGKISGLSASGLVLLDNGADSLAVSSGAASFKFPAALKNGSTYAVTVKTQPAGETCSVANGAGTISNANIGNVAVTCLKNSPWVWWNGSSSIGASAVYGTQGVASHANTPGARSNSVTWVDQAGNLWLFGGNLYHFVSGTTDFYNDLWEYSPTSHEWTWRGGSQDADAAGVYGTQGKPAAGNWPGGRAGGVAWVDSAGTLWLFGGFGYDSQGNANGLNDVWKYTQGSGQWTWVSGSSTNSFTTTTCPTVYGTKGMAAASNNPGPREDSAATVDGSGRLWLFGGEGCDPSGNSGALSDLWRFDPNSSQWTWLGGPQTAGVFGVYGTRGVAAASNQPGARTQATAWFDKNGDFWLFGGSGGDGSGAVGYLNDLWQYEPNTGNWTWLSGSSVTGGSSLYGTPGVYGTQGIAAPGNVPGARALATSWIDAAGQLWLLGGNGYDSTGYLYYENDLWVYQPSLGEWTWIGGYNDTSTAGGVYGTQGVAAPGNLPGVRDSAASWRESSGAVWLFGGAGVDALQPDGSYDVGFLNDLWQYIP